jgi:alpha-1,6-mannosyltransferase
MVANQLEPAGPAPSRVVGAVEIGSAGAVCAACYLALAVRSSTGDRIPLIQFFTLIVGASLATFWLWRRMERRGAHPAVAKWILVWGCVFRVIGLFGQPIYENDYYRYLWDGRTTALGGNPYRQSPSSSFGDESLPENFQRILDRINYPDVPTIYGPVCQFAFALSYRIGPGQLWPLKLIFLAADFAAAMILLRLLDRKHSIILYAWSPLIIKEVSFTAHTEILAAFFLLAAIQKFVARNAAAGGALLALAVAAKMIAVVFAPILLLKEKRRAVAAFAAVLCLVYGPFMASGAIDARGLGIFLDRWEFNSFGFALLSGLFGAWAGKLMSVLAFGAVLVWLMSRYVAGSIPPGDVLLGCFFLLSPVVNPWYLVLMAPFVTLRPSVWGLVALTTILLSYITGLNLPSGSLPAYNHPWWVRPLQILPVMAAVWLDAKRGGRWSGARSQM